MALKEKNRVRLCPICGKVLGYARKKYCSNLCRIKAPKKPRKRVGRKTKETLCWTCKNACGKCSWSKGFEPVDGWDAIPTKIKVSIETNEYTDSYFVKNCPLYERIQRG